MAPEVFLYANSIHRRALDAACFSDLVAFDATAVLRKYEVHTIPAATPRASPAHIAHFTAHCTTTLAAAKIYFANLDIIEPRHSFGHFSHFVSGMMPDILSCPGV